MRNADCPTVENTIEIQNTQRVRTVVKGLAESTGMAR